MNNQRKCLTDILSAGKASWLKNDWSKIQAAPDYGRPIPAGKYAARLLGGALDVARTGTPSYKLTFEIKDGPHAGRRCWYDVWLSDAAQRGAVRDFAKLGIHSQEQLERDLPAGMVCEIIVAVHREDSGTERNVVKTFTVTGTEAPEPNPFPPREDNAAPSGENPDGEPAGPVDTGSAPAGLNGTHPAPTASGGADAPPPRQGELPLPAVGKRGRRGAEGGPYAEGA
jgi:hypothetical protein